MPRTPSQFAVLYARAGALLVCSCSQTTGGRRIMNGSLVRLARDADDVELAAAIMHALGASLDGVADPPPTAGTPFEPVLRELGLRTYGHFMKGAEAVELTRAEDGVRITPMHNGGSRNGFSPIGEIAETIPAGDPAAIAPAVRRALSDAF